MPASNVEFWSAKITGNKARDRRCLRAIRLLGWKALVVWECETRTLASLAKLRQRLERVLGGGTAASPSLARAADEVAAYRSVKQRGRAGSTGGRVAGAVRPGKRAKVRGGVG